MQHIQQSISNQIARVVINRPEVHNAFNDDVIFELTSAFTELGNNVLARVIILLSVGASFCAGADLSWMKKMAGYSKEQNLEDARGLAGMFRVIRETPKPVIARVHGAAFGGGVGLVAACDMAVAVEAAKFSFSEVKLGILPSVIMPYVLEKTGPGPLRRYMLTAERFSATEAKRIGLLSEVASSADEMDRMIGELCEAIKKNGPEAVGACKKLIGEVDGRSWDALQSLTTERIAEIRVSSEGQEGMKAFLEKREPAWNKPQRS